jgi:hypothetical protein
LTGRVSETRKQEVKERADLLSILDLLFILDDVQEREPASSD